MPEELSIQERLQALAPKVDSPVRRALFEQFGPEKYADADYLNLLREALIDIYENGGGTGNGGTMDQDNIDIKMRIIIANDSLEAVLLAINNLFPYVVSDKQSVWFVCVQRGSLFSFSSTYKYKMLNHGKGKYGRGFTQLTRDDLELVYANVPDESDIDDPTTDTISFGALTTQTAAEWLSTKNPSITIKPQDLGYTLLKGTVNSIATSYLWIGAPGRYGTGYLAAAMTDLQLLSGEDAPVRNLTLGTTSQNAYRGDYGEIAYQHTRTAGNPHATQMADIPSLLTWLNDRLIGSRATDAEVQVSAAPTAQNKYIDTIRLFNWFSWIKTQAWNFTGSLKKNNVDVATINDVAGKLNNGSNMSLSGLSVRVPRVNADGTITADEFLNWIALNRELIIGSGTASGRLSILSQIFEFAVQDNIASGNANILFNAGQEDALSFKDKNGKVYMTFRSTADGIGMIFKQREVFDEGVFYPNSRRQAALKTEGAGVKVYATSALNAIVSIPMTTDTMTAIIDASFTLKNNTSTQFIVGRFRAAAKRVAGTITIYQGAIEILSNLTNPAYQTWAAGVEAVNNNSLQFFFTPAAGDSNNYTGVYYEIKYTLN
jgi:hypothetical protein